MHHAARQPKQSCLAALTGLLLGCAVVLFVRWQVPSIPLVRCQGPQQIPNTHDQICTAPFEQGEMLIGRLSGVSQTLTTKTLQTPHKGQGFCNRGFGVKTPHFVA